MCEICVQLGIDQSRVHALPEEFSLDPFAGLTYATKPIFTLDQVIGQIDSGRTFAARNGTITFSFLTTPTTIGIYNNPVYGFAEPGGYSPFSAAEMAAARDAIALWDDLIPQSFVEKKGVGADIIMANTTTGPGQAWAYYPGQGYKIYSDIWTADPTVNWTNNWFSPGGYGNTTLIHELGHTLGLSHPGNYNGPGATTYAAQAEYAQDSMQYSIMSYWAGSNTGALTVNWSLFLNNFAQTPMVHDIYVIQAKYGKDPNTRTGDTVYGFNSTADRDIYDFTKNPYPYLAIYDAGGNDTIDLSGFSASQFINLQPGSFSSIGDAIPTADVINANMDAHNAAMGTNYGDVSQATVTAVGTSYMNAAAARIQAFTGVSGIYATAHDNFGIAYGVTIENAIGGSARDLMYGNEVGNRLEGRGGNDVIKGFGGNDTLIGGTGADQLFGGEGDDLFVYNAPDEGGDTIMDWNSGDKIDLRALGDLTFVGNAAFSGAGQVRYEAGVVSIDFDGDGVADFSIAVSGNPTIGAGDFLMI